jgi:hypothetical protein
MSNEGITFVSNWIESHVTQIVKDSVDGDVASLSVEMAEQLIADAAKAGLSLSDLEPDLGAPEVLIREALESDEGATGD